jgi:putative secretion ATPase (PEP-CTERM system associated)
MYERFYQLRDRPFALSPDPDYLYPSRVHREALDYLRFGIEGHAGFVVITGEIGSGKTTLLQVLLRNLDGNTTVVRLVNTLLTGRELIESMLLDLGVEIPTPTKPAMLRDLARELVAQRAAGRRVIAVIDEAQNLAHDALEELRMLSNLETEKSKLIQIVLVGQPDLRDTLELPSLEQLRQRVTVRYHIDPLDAIETARYINHRLKRAAVGAPMEFPHDVTAAVHARSGGVPRLINVICDAVLLCGYAEERRLIDLDLVRTAVEELELSSILRRPHEAARSDTPRSQPTPASTPVTPAPPVRATFDDLPLRRDSREERNPWDLRQPPAAAAAAPRARPAVDARTAVAPSRPVDAARRLEPIEARTRAVAAMPREAARVQAPVQRASLATFEPERPRSNGAWTWMKETFFGPGPQTGRR